MGDVLYMVCPREAFDAVTSACSVPLQAVDAPSLLPYLSVEDGAKIAVAIIGVWSLGFVFKLIRRSLETML